MTTLLESSDVPPFPNQRPRVESIYFSTDACASNPPSDSTSDLISVSASEEFSGKNIPPSLSHLRMINQSHNRHRPPHQLRNEPDPAPRPLGYVPKAHKSTDIHSPILFAYPDNSLASLPQHQQSIAGSPVYDAPNSTDVTPQGHAKPSAGPVSQIDLEVADAKDPIAHDSALKSQPIYSPIFGIGYRDHGNSTQRQHIYSGTAMEKHEARNLNVDHNAHHYPSRLMQLYPRSTLILPDFHIEDRIFGVSFHCPSCLNTLKLPASTTRHHTLPYEDEPRHSRDNETNPNIARYEDGEVLRYGAGESYRPFNRDRDRERSPRRARSPMRDRDRERERDRDRDHRPRTPPIASDSYVPNRSPRRRSRSPDRYRGPDRARDSGGESWRRRDSSRGRPRSPIRRISPRRSPRRSPGRYSPPPRRDDRFERARSPRRDFDIRDR